MKKLILSSIFAILITSTISAIQPFYNLGSVSDDMATSISKVKSEVTAKGYEVIGEYKPGNNDNLYVIAYTNSSLKTISSSFEKRGYLASVMRIGLVKKEGKVIISMTNPEYIFNAYFGEALENTTKEASVTKVANKVIADIKTIGTEFKAFGGDIDKDDLREYHYMFGMPYFSDPVELKEFASFEDGIRIIKKNLATKKGSAIKVYELIDKTKKVAVFGVGLLDPEDGEAKFLSIIGESHVSAMPYEIILQGNEATMLHGRFRFALYWPELTMGTFTKIMSTPGYVEDALGVLVK